MQSKLSQAERERILGIIHDRFFRAESKAAAILIIFEVRRRTDGKTERFTLFPRVDFPRVRLAIIIFAESLARSLGRDESVINAG